MKGGVIYRQFAPYDDEYHKSQDENNFSPEKDRDDDKSSEQRKKYQDELPYEEKMALRMKTEGYCNRQASIEKPGGKYVSVN
jgi:hypothetical protein